jgi:hypothetical protein
MSTEIKSILVNKNLSTYQKMVLIIIHTYEAEHGYAFPSYVTIAAQGSMSKRKAQYVVKELVEAGYLEKETRFKKVGGQIKQLSNRYTSVDDAQHAQVSEQPCEQNAPYGASSNAFNNYEDEDNIIHAPIEFTEYIETETEMAQNNGGSPSFKDTEFLAVCRLYKTPNILVKAIYRGVKQYLGEYHIDAIHSTFEKFTERFMKGRICAPVKWFISPFFNANLRLRSTYGPVQGTLFG